MILTGVSAGLYYNAVRIGKVKNIDMEVTREALRTTTVADFAHTYIAGLRDAKASATLFYDPLDAAAVSMINSIYANNPSGLGSFQFMWDLLTGRQLTHNALLTSMGLSAAFGEAHICKIAIQLSGSPTSSAL
jgi:hypothetical protein